PGRIRRVLRPAAGAGQATALGAHGEVGGMEDETGGGGVSLPSVAAVLTPAAAGPAVPVVVRNLVVGPGGGPEPRHLRREPDRPGRRDRVEFDRPADDEPEHGADSAGRHGGRAFALRSSGDGRDAGSAGAGGVGRGAANRHRDGVACYGRTREWRE